MNEERAYRYAIERLLEDESLTADLVDAGARVLIDWTISRAEAILRETEGAPEKRRERLAALRHTMRHISELAGQSSPKEQAEQVQALLAAQESGVESDEQSNEQSDEQ